ncbi:cytochrome P450, partial [Mycena floridula]
MTWLAATTALIVITLALILLYPNRLIGTRNRTGIPGPRGFPLVGNLFSILPWRFRSVEWVERMHTRYGDFFTVTTPPWGRAIVIGRPEWLAHVKAGDTTRYSRGPIAKEIFSEFPGKRTPVASEGTDWRVTRRIIAPIFTVNSFTNHVSRAMKEIMDSTRVLLSKTCEEGLIIDWNDMSGRVALSIFTLSALSLKGNLIQPDTRCLSQSDPLRDALLTLNGISSSRFLNPVWHWTEWLDGTGRLFKQSRDIIWGIVDNIIQSRVMQFHEEDFPDDYLSALLRDSDFNGDTLLIRDTVATLLFAGHDNTQNVLVWAMHALLKHPDWMEKMRREAQILCKTVEDEVTFESLPNYHIHLAVFYEVVRLWPGLPKNARLALQDDILPAIPEHNLPALPIYKGDFVCWSDRYMMRNSKTWGADSETFNPGRHLDSDGKFVRPSAPEFHGFGAGPRFCPAVQLAAYEFVACWAGLLPGFEFRAKYTHEPKLMEAFTSCMDGPLAVEVQFVDM